MGVIEGPIVPLWRGVVLHFAPPTAEVLRAGPPIGKARLGVLHLCNGPPCAAVQDLYTLNQDFPECGHLTARTPGSKIFPLA